MQSPGTREQRIGLLLAGMSDEEREVYRPMAETLVDELEEA